MHREIQDVTIHGMRATVTATMHHRRAMTLRVLCTALDPFAGYTRLSQAILVSPPLRQNLTLPLAPYPRGQFAYNVANGASHGAVKRVFFILTPPRASLLQYVAALRREWRMLLSISFNGAGASIIDAVPPLLQIRFIQYVLVHMRSCPGRSLLHIHVHFYFEP